MATTPLPRRPTAPRTRVGGASIHRRTAAVTLVLLAIIAPLTPAAPSPEDLEATVRVAATPLLVDAAVRNATPEQVDAALDRALAHLPAPSQAMSRQMLLGAYDPHAQAFVFREEDAAVAATATRLALQQLGGDAIGRDLGDRLNEGLAGLLGPDGLPPGWHLPEGDGGKEFATHTGVAVQQPTPLPDLRPQTASTTPASPPSCPDEPAPPPAGSSSSGGSLSNLAVFAVHGTGSDEHHDVEAWRNDTGTRSGLIDLAVCGQFHWDSTGGSHAFSVRYTVEQDGDVREQIRVHTISGSGAGASDLETVVFKDVDLNRGLKVRVRLDEGNAFSETDETDNDVLLELDTKPTVQAPTSRLRGNFLASTAMDFPNHYTTTTEDPPDPHAALGVGRVQYRIIDAGGTTVRWQNGTDAGDDWSGAVEIGSLGPGRYRVQAVSITPDGARSGPAESSFWMVGLPGLMGRLDALGLVSHDPESPDEVNAPAGMASGPVRYYGEGTSSLTFEIDDAASSQAKQIVREVKSLGLCTSEADDDLSISYDVSFEHELVSDPTTWTGDVTASGSVSVAGISVFLSASGSATWTFSSGSGTWSVESLSVTASASGTLRECDLIRGLNAIFPGLGSALKKTDAVEALATISVSGTVDATLHRAATCLSPVPLDAASFTNDLGLSVTLVLGDDDWLARATGTATGSMDFGAAYQCRPIEELELTRFGLLPNGLSVDLQGETRFVIKVFGVEVEVTASKTFLSKTYGDNYDNCNLFWPRGSSLCTPSSSAMSLSDLAVRDSGTATTVTTADASGHPPMTTATVPSGDVLVADAPGGRTSAAVAADATGTVLVLHDSDNFGRPTWGEADVRELVRQDGVWSSPGYPLGTDRVDADGKIAASADGRAVAAAHRITRQEGTTASILDDLGTARIEVSFRDTDGTWSMPTALAPSSGYNHNPKVAMGADGRTAAVTWLHKPGGQFDDLAVPKAVVWRDGIQVSPVIEPPSSAGYHGSPSPVVLPNGVVVVAYVKLHDDGNTTLLARSLAPTASTWSPAEVVSGGASRPLHPRLAADGAGVSLVWSRLEQEDSVLPGGNRWLVESTVPMSPNPLFFAGGTAFANLERVVVQDEVYHQEVVERNRFRELDVEADGAGGRSVVWLDDSGLVFLRYQAVPIVPIDFITDPPLPPIPPLPDPDDLPPEGLPGDGIETGPAGRCIEEEGEDNPCATVRHALTTTPPPPSDPSDITQGILSPAAWGHGRPLAEVRHAFDAATTDPSSPSSEVPTPTAFLAEPVHLRIGLFRSLDSAFNAEAQNLAIVTTRYGSGNGPMDVLFLEVGLDGVAGMLGPPP